MTFYLCWTLLAYSIFSSIYSKAPLDLGVCTRQLSWGKQLLRLGSPLRKWGLIWKILISAYWTIITFLAVWQLPSDMIRSYFIRLHQTADEFLPPRKLSLKVRIINFPDIPPGTRQNWNLNPQTPTAKLHIQTGDTQKSKPGFQPLLTHNQVVKINTVKTRWDVDHALGHNRYQSTMDALWKQTLPLHWKQWHFQYIYLT